ncbi:MAG: cytochrome P450 [Myxococcaceae bacterium]|jgi:cytochrome P450|nr:cytochrome P450 [Myxococcaceae bacterium]
MKSTAALTLASVPGLPLLGALPDLQKNPLRVMERATLDYAPAVRLPLPIVDSLVVSDPALVEHILVTNSRNYVKQTRGYDMLRKVLGNGLVTSEGEFWKRQRRIAQPAFHRERLVAFGETMTRAATDMVDGWKPGVPFDAAEAFMQVTLRLVGETLLSSDVTSEASAVGRAITVALEHLIHRTLHPFGAPEWVPTPRNLGFRRALRTLDDVVHGLIAERRKGGGPQGDLLAMLMEATDPETGEGMSDAQLRDEVMTIFLAGHETTANALAWTVMLLGRAPEVERQVLAELDAVLQGRTPTMGDVPKLPFLGMVLKESMRLYPPVWSLARRVVEREVVQGVTFEKGSLVFLCTFALHRHPGVWRDPEAFDPSRWAPGAPPPPKGAYLPFSTGQRKCIGDTFATVEATLILATLLSRVHLELVPGQTFEPEPVITLRPKGGVHVVATPR